jgi:16S rRNA (uracil1498-N3)-methyltransferase
VRRFYLPGGPEGGEALLRGQERDHLVKVLRLGPGDEVALFDGRGGEWLARVAAVDPAAVRLEVVSELRGGAEPAFELWLAQALLKGKKADWLVQKACELGVRRLTFVSSEHAVARGPAAENAAARLARWRRICAEALKQCRGCLLPEIDGPRPLAGLLKEPFEGARFILHEAEGMGLSEAVAGAGKVRRAQLVVGPEGGLSQAEVELARGVGFAVVRLGARVLRAETAALAVSAALLYAAGELG